MLSAGTNMDAYRLDKIRLDVVLNRHTAAVRDGPHRVVVGGLWRRVPVLHAAPMKWIIPV